MELKIVVIEAPAFHMQNKEARDIYGKLIRLKIDAYETLESGYKAYDETDIFANHYVLCSVTNGNLEPLIAFKSMSHQWATEWGLSLYGVEAIKQTGSIPHYKAIKNIFEHSLERYGNFAYTASLALEPSVRKDKELRRECMKVFESLMCRIHHEFDFERSCTLVRARTGIQKFLYMMGFEGLKLNGEELDDLYIPKYEDSYRVMVMKKTSEGGNNLIAQYEGLWSARCHFDWRKSNQSHKYTQGRQNKSKKAS